MVTINLEAEQLILAIHSSFSFDSNATNSAVATFSADSIVKLDDADVCTKHSEYMMQYMQPDCHIHKSRLLANSKSDRNSQNNNKM